MKKFNFLFLGILEIAFAIIYKTEVKASNNEEFYEAEWIPNIYINKVLSTGNKKYQQGLFLRRKSDNHYVYCLEPFSDLLKNVYYDSPREDFVTNLKISEENLQRINLLAYYGYMYKNHEEPKWYAITQLLIWRTLYPRHSFYFTETLNGKRMDNAFLNEINELEDLVAKHNNKMSFLNDKIEINLGEKVILNDQNNVLHNYKITASTVSANIDGDNLILNGNQIGKKNIEFLNEDTLYSNNLMYYRHNTSQNILLTGSYKPIKVNLNVKVNGFALKIVKKDYDTKENLHISNLKFKIQNLDTGEFIINPKAKDDDYIFYTNNEGYFITPNTLGYGKYAIFEENNSLKDYSWNQTPLIIELNKDTIFSHDNNLLYYETSFYNKLC